MNFKLFILTILIAKCFYIETKPFFSSHFYPRPQAKPFGYNPSMYISHIRSPAVSARNKINNKNLIVNSENSNIINHNYIYNRKPVHYSSNYISNSNLISNSIAAHIVNKNIIKTQSQGGIPPTQISRVPLKNSVLNATTKNSFGSIGEKNSQLKANRNSKLKRTP